MNLLPQDWVFLAAAKAAHVSSRTVVATGMRLTSILVLFVLAPGSRALAENHPKMIVREFGAVGIWSPNCNGGNKPGNFNMEIQDRNEQQGDPPNKDYSNDPATMSILEVGGKMFPLEEVESASVDGGVLTMRFPEDRFAAGHGWEIQPATSAMFQKKGRRMLVSGDAFAKFASKPVLVQLCRRN